MPAAKKQKGKAKKDVGYRHPKSKDEDEVWQVPTSGLIRTRFSIDDALVDAFGDDCLDRPVGNSRIATNYLKAHLAKTKFQPSFRKIVPLLAQFRGLCDQPQERRLILDALSRDFWLDFPHIHQLCKVRSDLVDVLTRLGQCVFGSAIHQWLAMTCMSLTFSEFLRVYRKCEPLLSFNAENPTGHYKLNLGSAADYSVAESLRLLDRWEAVITRHRGCEDLSMHGF